MAEEDKSKEELYYMENGLVVFTAAFLLKRGYCCKRGCRHCPYPKSTDKLSNRLKPDGEEKD